MADKAEVFQVTSQRTPVHFEANRLKQIQFKETTSTALRIVKNGRIGFAQVSGHIKPDELVAMALETSNFGVEANFDFPSAQPYPELQIYDPRIEKISTAEMVRLGEALIDKVVSHTPQIQCEAMLSCGVITCRIANSSGLFASYTRSNYSLGLEGMLVKDGDLLFVGDSQSSCKPIEDYNPIASEVIRQLELSERIAGLPSATLPVIFTPMGVAASLISPLISAFNGKTVFDGASPLKGKKGLKIFDERLFLWDDATIPWGPCSAPFDDEGVPTRRNLLVNAGTVYQFYYDLHTAALAKTSSTGNGDRSGGMPSPSPHALIIDAGDTSQEDMVHSIKQGLIIEQLMGAEQGNILNGDFSGNVLLGYKIDNGEISGRVKDTMVYGNIYQLLGKIDRMGNDSRWIAGYIKTPSIYCPGISVSSKSG